MTDEIDDNCPFCPVEYECEKHLLAYFATTEGKINGGELRNCEAEINKIYRGTVKRIMDFGAFVEIFPGTDGLVHISQLAEGRVQNVRDVLKEGDEVMVKVLEIDKQGKIKLSRKEALNHSPEKQ